MSDMYKYELGTRVFLVEMTDIPSYHNCKMCDGLGEIEIVKVGGNKKITCPECKGEKKLSSGGSIEYYVNSDPRNIIKTIRIIIDEYGKRLDYHLKSKPDASGYLESQLFSTEEEAKVYCKKENKGKIMGYTN